MFLKLVLMASANNAVTLPILALECSVMVILAHPMETVLQTLASVEPVHLVVGTAEELYAQLTTNACLELVQAECAHTVMAIQEVFAMELPALKISIVLLLHVFKVPALSVTIMAAQEIICSVMATVVLRVLTVLQKLALEEIV